MSVVVTALALLGVLFVGVIVGLLWRGSVVIGDRRTLHRLSASMEAEHRMRAATRAAMAASRRVVREGQGRTWGQP